MEWPVVIRFYEGNFVYKQAHAHARCVMT